MTRRRSAEEERALIVGQPLKRPYGARLCAHTQTTGMLGSGDWSNVPLPTGAVLRVYPGRKAPWEGGEKVVIDLEGFATASGAELAGRRLVRALLWTAVALDYPVRLEYQSYEPASVFERNRSTGVTCESYGHVGFAPAIVQEHLGSAYLHPNDPEQNLLLSMEIFCAARLETSERARFLSLVSSFEPLAAAQSLGPAVETLVGDCVRLALARTDVTPETRNSLVGRLSQLKNESVRQALRRLVRNTIPERYDAWSVVDDAYALRSQLVHTGKPVDLDVDLERESVKVRSLLREIYSRMLQRPLVRPSPN